MKLIKITAEGYVRFSNLVLETFVMFMPALTQAVLAYSDGSQFRFTAELQSTWLVR